MARITPDRNSGDKSGAGIRAVPWLRPASGSPVLGPAVGLWPSRGWPHRSARVGGLGGHSPPRRPRLVSDTPSGPGRVYQPHADTDGQGKSGLARLGARWVSSLPCPRQVMQRHCRWAPAMSLSQSSRSVVSKSLHLWTAARQASLSITNSQSLLKPMSTESVIPSNHPILCRALLLLPSIFPSIRVFSVESALHIRWPKYWSFSFNISPSNEHPGLISFRMDWLDLLAVRGTLKSLLQHHSSKASIL